MQPKTKAWLAFAFICLVWGTTYLAIRLAVDGIPAFLMAGTRQVVSGLVLLVVALAISRKVDLSKRNLWQQTKIGFLMITLGNGLVSWGEQYIPSGVAAIICGLMPVAAVIINLVTNKRERLNAFIGAGLLLGFGGVALIFRNDIASLASAKYVGGIVACLCATSSWAMGSIFSKKGPKSFNPVFNAGLQLLLGGAILLIASPVVDDYHKLKLTTEAIWSVVYLIVFGSVLAYTAYLYVLKVLPTGVATSYAYINPLIAVLLGIWFKDGEWSWYILLSVAMILTSVYLVRKGYQQNEQLKVLTD